MKWEPIEQKWQPIEAATNDVGHCFFFGNTRHDLNAVFSGWVAINGMLYSDNGDLCRPTHWMPLPAPPETTK